MSRSERDLGRSKRPSRDQRDKRQKPRAEGRAPTRSGSPSRPEARSQSGGSRAPKRPRSTAAGSGARIIAPLALIIFAIACFAVLTTHDSASTSNSSDGSAATKATTTSGAAKTNAPTRSTYRVKPGDSFAAIAEKMNVDVQTLQELNPEIDPRALQPGQKLKLK